MKRSKILKLSLLLSVLLYLVGCGSGEQYLRETIENIDKDFVIEMNHYVELNSQQNQNIIETSKIAAQWFKEHQVITLKQILESLQKPLQYNQVVDQAVYVTLLDFLANPLSFVGSDAVMKNLADIAYTLNDEQVLELQVNLNKEVDDLQKKAEKLNLEKGNKEIVDAFQFVFRDLGVRIGQTQKDYLHATLITRKPLEMQFVEADRQWNTMFINNLNDRKKGEEVFKKQFIELWRQSEDISENVSQDDWQYNRRLMVEAISGLISSLSPNEKNILVSRLQDYINLLEELSQS